MSKGGSSGNQTVTQQNIPDWALNYAQNTLDMGRYNTNNQDYRPSTLDRDYFGVRGYNNQGQPNSQVGQFGLNPSPAQPQPELEPEPVTGNLFGKGGGFGGGFGTAGTGSTSGADPGMGGIGSPSFGGGFDGAGRPGSTNETVLPSSSGRIMQNMGPDSFRSRGGGRVYGTSPGPSSGQGQSYTPAENGGDSYEVYDQSTNPASGLTDPVGEGVLIPSGGSSSNSQTTQNSTTGETQTTQPTAGMSQAQVQALIDKQLQQFDLNTITPDELPTPFQSYDRQRFAGPSADTMRGEGILSGRYDQRFGKKGIDPFAAANQAVGSAANYKSGFQGTTGGIGGQAGNYQQGLGSATNPNVFQSGNYTSGLPNFANPNADMRNVNAGIGNVNAGLRSQQFGNANQGIQGPVNYQQERTLQQKMAEFQNPYTQQVVNQTIKDMDRARKMTANQISGDAAKAGAFGSRAMLMQAENNRNFADRTAAAVGNLRSQGFSDAANLAQQENLQRLGLSASDVQNVRGLDSSGNLQGQQLSASDLQNVRGLQSQGALTAQGLRSQGGLAAQGLQSQGALAALGENAGLYQSALGLNAAGDRSAMGYNAGLLGDAMRLDASDLNQRRNIASNESQFAESANRGAGALNLQGGQALGQLAQAGTADERQRIADMLASGGAQMGRDQQDLDFIRSEFDRELDYPGRQIDLRNAAISPATGSIVTTSQPRYQASPLAQAGGPALAMYAATKGNPYLTAAAAAYGLLS